MGGRQVRDRGRQVRGREEEEGWKGERRERGVRE